MAAQFGLLPLIFIGAAVVGYTSMKDTMPDNTDRAVASLAIGGGSILGAGIGGTVGGLGGLVVGLGVGAVTGSRATRSSKGGFIGAVAGAGIISMVGSVGGMGYGTYKGYDLTKTWALEAFAGEKNAALVAPQTKIQITYGAPALKAA